LERLTFAVSQSKVEGRTLSGVAHAYGQVTTDARKHSFAPGAFAKSIAKGGVVSFAFHDDTKLLATQKAGTLRLQDGSDGLKFELDLPEGVSYAEDLKALLKAGVEPGMSFGVLPGKSSTKAGVRTFTEAELVSVDPVAMPAFEGTSIILNSAGWPGTSHTTTVTIRARVRAARMHSERGA